MFFLVSVQEEVLQDMALIFSKHWRWLALMKRWLFFRPLSRQVSEIPVVVDLLRFLKNSSYYNVFRLGYRAR